MGAGHADSEVTITPGATEAIFCAIQAVIHPGDEVIVFDPCYDSYEPSVELAGGRCVHVQLSRRASASTGSAWPMPQPRTRMIILNSPHNPSGALIARRPGSLAALIRDRDIYLVSDEVYEHLVYDGVRTSACWPRRAVRARLRGQLVRQDLPRHRLEDRLRGRAAGADAELRKVHQYVNFCGVTPLQCALADFMAEHPEHIASCRASTRPSAICSATCWRLAFQFPRAAGTYFQVVDYSQIRPDLDDVDMPLADPRARRAAIPVSVFYQQPRPSSAWCACALPKRGDAAQAAENYAI
jgi:methionine aminotransferase